MAMITIAFDDRAVLDALRDLSARAVNLRPALKEIGEDLVASTKDRFNTSTGPDGQRWEPNSETTVLGYLAGVKGAYGKKNGLTQKGMKALLGKKPLVRDGYLQDTLNYQVDGDTLLVGSPQKYAAVQQFGAKQGEFGQNRRGRPIPYGDIPARPFLGVSDADQRSILETLGHYLVP
jgi:phage virion morphogenesis protein